MQGTWVRNAFGAVAMALALGGCTVLARAGGPHTAHDLAMAPAPPRVVATPEPPPPPRELIEIHDQIRFDFDSDRLLGASEPVLAEVARLIGHNGEIRRVRVEGNTDARGDAAHNQDLSTRRAAAVAEWLRAHGVTVALESAGRGQANPLCTEDTEACHQRNRRVEFVIVERGDASASAQPTPARPANGG